MFIIQRKVLDITFIFITMDETLIYTLYMLDIYVRSITIVKVSILKILIFTTMDVALIYTLYTVKVLQK
jgi:hypothetical protein